jgi:hypothetical protein
MEFKKCSIGSYTYGTDSDFFFSGNENSKYFNEGVTNVNFNDLLFEEHW